MTLKEELEGLHPILFIIAILMILPAVYTNHLLGIIIWAIALYLATDKSKNLSNERGYNRNLTFLVIFFVIISLNLIIHTPSPTVYNTPQYITQMPTLVRAPTP